jgi:hypothetical protein
MFVKKKIDYMDWYYFYKKWIKKKNKSVFYLIKNLFIISYKKKAKK